MKWKTEVETDLGFLLIQLKRRIRKRSVTATSAAAGRGKQSGQRSVFIKAEKQSDHDGQTAAVENARTKRAVFRTEDKQSDKDPKGYVTLGATIHKKPPVSCRRTYVF